MLGTAIINHGNWLRLVAPTIVNKANCVTDQILVAPISKAGTVRSSIVGVDTESVGPWTRSLQSKQTSCLQEEDWWQNPSQWDYRGTTGLNRIAEPPSPVTYLYKGASGIIRMANKYHTPISDKHGLQCHRPLQYFFTAVRVKDTFSVCVWFQNHEFVSQRHFYYVCDSKIMNRCMLKN